MTQIIRPQWHETWMNIAKEIAKRSYDPRLQVGAIIVSNDNSTVLSVGYNGNYAGGPNVQASEKEGDSGFLHSEINAIIKCDYHFHKDKVMYVTHFPCPMCCKAIINAGIKTVIYDKIYRDMNGSEFFKQTGVEAIKMSYLVKLFKDSSS